MKLEAPAIAGKSVVLSVGETFALALRSGFGVRLLRDLEQSVAAWHLHRQRVCSNEELQVALDHFRKQARLTAAEDFHAFLSRLDAGVDEVLDVFRAGFYRRLITEPRPVELALTLRAIQLLPMAAFVEGHWAHFAKKGALMVAAYESQDSSCGHAGRPEGLSGDELRKAAEILCVNPGRLELVGRICNCFQQLCARTASAPECEAERALMATNLTQVATLEAHAASDEIARELYLCGIHDNHDLLELCRETNTLHESCLHEVALLRARPGWQPVAFAAPGAVVYVGAWEGAHLVARVLERRVPGREDLRLERRLAEAIVEKHLVREREVVRVLVD